MNACSSRITSSSLCWLLSALGFSGANEMRAQANSVESTRSDSTAAERSPSDTERQWHWGFGVGRLGLSTMNTYQKPTADPPAMAAFIGAPQYSPGFFTLSLLAERNHRSLCALTLAYRDQALHFEQEYGEFASGTSKDYLARLSWAYYLVRPHALDRTSFLFSAGPAVYYLNRDYQKQYADTSFGFRSVQRVQARILFIQVGPNVSIRKRNWMVSAAGHFNLFGWISGGSGYDVTEHPGPNGPYRDESHFKEAVGVGFLSDNSILLNDLEMSLVFLF